MDGVPLAMNFWSCHAAKELIKILPRGGESQDPSCCRSVWLRLLVPYLIPYRSPSGVVGGQRGAARPARHGSILGQLQGRKLPELPLVLEGTFSQGFPLGETPALPAAGGLACGLGAGCPPALVILQRGTPGQHPLCPPSCHDGALQWVLSRWSPAALQGVVGAVAWVRRGGCCHDGDPQPRREWWVLSRQSPAALQGVVGAVATEPRSPAGCGGCRRPGAARFPGCSFLQLPPGLGRVPRGRHLEGSAG